MLQKDIRIGRYFTESFKRRIVRSIESGHTCEAAVKEKYSIKGHSTILRWLREYGKRALENKPSSNVSKRPMGKKSKSELSEVNLLKNRIKQLERKVDDAEKTEVVLRCLIDTISDHVGYDIGKKFGAKQLIKRKK